MGKKKALRTSLSQLRGAPADVTHVIFVGALYVWI